MPQTHPGGNRAIAILRSIMNMIHDSVDRTTVSSQAASVIDRPTTRPPAAISAVEPAQSHATEHRDGHLSEYVRPAWSTVGPPQRLPSPEFAAPGSAACDGGDGRCRRVPSRESRNALAPHEPRQWSPRAVHTVAAIRVLLRAEAVGRQSRWDAGLLAGEPVTPSPGG